MPLLECVPQCDFTHLEHAPERVYVDGDAYHYRSQRDRDKAYAQRIAMLRAVVDDADCFTISTDPDIVFGATWSLDASRGLGAFWVYSHELDTLWVYGDPEIVVGRAGYRAPEMMQRIRKMLVVREIDCLVWD